MKAPSLLLSLLLAACSSAADPPAQIAEDDAGAPSRSDGGGETVIPQKDAAPDAPPCVPGGANFPQCRGGVRHVFSIGCSTRRAPGCLGEGGFAGGELDAGEAEGNEEIGEEGAVDLVVVDDEDVAIGDGSISHASRLPVRLPQAAAPGGTRPRPGGGCRRRCGHPAR